MRSNLVPSALAPASEARTSVAFSKFAASRLVSRRSVEVKSMPTRFAPLRSLPLRMISFLSHSVQSTPGAAVAEQSAWPMRATGKRESSDRRRARPAARRSSFRFPHTKSMDLFPGFLGRRQYQLAARRHLTISLPAGTEASVSGFSRFPELIEPELSFRKPAAETA